MKNNLLENTKTQVTPETDIGVGLVRPAPGVALHGKTRAMWEEGNKDSGRPPWGLLLLGIAALSVVYWLWGQETERMPLRVSTSTPMSALTREVLSTTPTVSLPDGTVLFLTKDSFIAPLTVCDLFIGKSGSTCIPAHS
jgi:hypothetical protein